MKHEIFERTLRQWVQGNPGRAQRQLRRLDAASELKPGQSAEEIVEALIRFAGRMELAEGRLW